jgi:hypothetical protein
MDMEWKDLALLVQIQCCCVGVLKGQIRMFWVILLLWSERTSKLLWIRVVYSPVGVFVASIRGKRIDMALVVSYSLLLLGCAERSNSRDFTHVVSCSSGSKGTLAELTCIYPKGCVSRYHCWEMNGYCISCVTLSVGAWVCSNANFACFESYCQFHFWQDRKSCGFDLYIFERVCFSIIRGKWVGFALVVSSSVLLVGSAKTLYWNLLSTIVHFASKNTETLYRINYIV